MVAAEGFLAWIAGIATILIIVWRVGVKIERRIGEINTRMAENIQKLEGDRRVLEERVNNISKNIDSISANIDKLDNRFREIETLAWQSSPSRARSIREKSEEEERTQ